MSLRVLCWLTRSFAAQDLTVGAILSRKSREDRHRVHHVLNTSKVADAVGLMVKLNIGALLVKNEDGRCVGLVSTHAWRMIDAPLYCPQVPPRPLNLFIPRCD